jgi:hypothetical protein
MDFHLSAGDVLCIGGAIILTVVAVEADRIVFGMESSEGKCPGAGEIGKDHEETDFE